ncbi:hypothetical protein [Methylomonas fluvii]|nr:hypothetical protein [Methylomonas fluvii]
MLPKNPVHAPVGRLNNIATLKFDENADLNEPCWFARE